MYIWLLYVWLLWYLYVWLLWYKSYVPSVYFQFIFQYLLIGDLITHHCDHILVLGFWLLEGWDLQYFGPPKWCPIVMSTSCSNSFFFHILSGFDTMVKISCVHLGRVGVLRASSCVSALFSVTFLYSFLLTLSHVFDGMCWLLVMTVDDKYGCLSLGRSVGNGHDAMLFQRTYL